MDPSAAFLKRLLGSCCRGQHTVTLPTGCGYKPHTSHHVLSPYLLHIQSCTRSRNCSSSCNPRPVLAGAGNIHTVPPCLAPGWWAAKAWEEIREITLFLFTAFSHHVSGFKLTCIPPIQEAIILCTGFSPCLPSRSGEHYFSEKGTFIPLGFTRSSCSCHNKYISCPTAQYNKQCPGACPRLSTIWCRLLPPLKSVPKGIGRKPTSSLAPLICEQ